MRTIPPFRLMEIAPDMLHPRKLALALAPLLAVCAASPALADVTPATRLVPCGTESCLLVTGHRESRAATVRINGHRVEVQGKRNWRVRLPLSTVREWSVPFARKLAISSQGEADSVETLQHAELPIGLLGHVPDLASLVITLH